MAFYILLILIPAAAFATVTLAAAAAAGAAWPLVRDRARGTTASSRARVIGALRLGPAAMGMFVALILTVAFVRFEPRNTTETPGVLLSLAAAVTLALLACALIRALRAMRIGAECARLLRVAGRRQVADDGTTFWVLDTHFPVAAVTGIFRTRLLLSARLIRECTPGELDVIVRHERAHIRRRDNLVRAAMRHLPDPLAFMRAGREMEAAWAAAAEEAADDVAAGETGERRAVLASALVRVAKMAKDPVPEWMPGLAFYEGTNLETRVCRLVEGRSFPTSLARHSLAMFSLLLAGCSVLTLTEPAARQLHAWMEAAVQFVP